MDRLSKLLFGIDKSMKILEIGPGYNPAIRKASTGQALQAHHANRLRHTRQTAFENAAYNATSSLGITWGPSSPPGSLALINSLTAAKQVFDEHSEDVGSPYQDYHCWIFTPASFQLLVKELAYLGAIDFRVFQPFPTEGCEFFCSLRRGRGPILDEAALEEERLGLLMQVCVDLGAQTEYILPLVRPRVAGAVPTATDARIAAIERQLAIAIGRLDVYEGRLHQMHRVVNWPRRASRKVRKKIGRWLLSDTRPRSTGRLDG